RHVGREPQVLAPRFEFMASQDPLYRLGRDRVYDLIGDRLPSKFGAVPMRERTPNIIQSLAGYLDQKNGNLGGKRPAGGRSVSHRKALRSRAVGIAQPTCKDDALQC